jgi:hypothetical protein
MTALGGDAHEHSDWQDAMAGAVNLPCRGTADVGAGQRMMSAALPGAARRRTPASAMIIGRASPRNLSSSQREPS